MPVWLCLGGTLVLNYWRHKTGRSTLCSTGRERVGPIAFLLGWAAVSGWLLPHYCGPFYGLVQRLEERSVGSWGARVALGLLFPRGASTRTPISALGENCGG